MWALKIGGSILHASAAESLAASRGVLLACLRAHPGRCLLIPGGGLHADAVRAAQRVEGFDDDTAHVRALAAMDTCAAELVDLLRPTARVVERLADARTTAAEGLTPVWAPHAELATDQTIPRDWSLTSDSIAAIAGRRLRLDGVCLLKSCAVPKGATAVQLAASRIVDAEWPGNVNGLDSRVLGPEAWAVASGLEWIFGGSSAAPDPARA